MQRMPVTKLILSISLFTTLLNGVTIKGGNANGASNPNNTGEHGTMMGMV
jgi:hypothetical protein